MLPKFPPAFRRRSGATPGHSQGRSKPDRRQRKNRRGPRSLLSIDLAYGKAVSKVRLHSLVTGPAGLWNVAASITQPIFEGGRLKSERTLAEAQHEQMVLTYQQTIQGAFKRRLERSDRI